MSKWKALAILFSLFTFGALRETYRIFNSDAPDISANRAELKITGIIISLIVLSLAIYFWRKESDKKLY